MEEGKSNGGRRKGGKERGGDKGREVEIKWRKMGGRREKRLREEA